MPHTALNQGGVDSTGPASYLRILAIPDLLYPGFIQLLLDAFYGDNKLDVL
jgi:hypothetical protein